MSRKTQVQKLIDAMFNGVQADFAKAIDKGAGQVNHWLTEVRNIGDGVASQIETKLDLPRGWLDSKADVPLEAIENTNKDGIIFNRLNISAKMGNGHINDEHTEIVDQVKTTTAWARRHIGGNLPHIQLITAEGDSMQGTIEAGEMVFVDTTVTEYRSEGIYVLADQDGNLRIKRLFRHTNGDLSLISDNNTYPTETLAGEDQNQIHICGRVVAHSFVKKL